MFKGFAMNWISEWFRAGVDKRARDIDQLLTDLDLRLTERSRRQLVPVSVSTDEVNPKEKQWPSQS